MTTIALIEEKDASTEVAAIYQDIRKTKEMIAVAVAAANGCDYCVLAHTAAFKSMGGTDAALVELMAVVDVFSGFNKMLEGLQVAPDIGA